MASKIKITKTDLAKISIESILIVFSILLAVAVNEWRHNQLLESQKDRYLALIMGEIQDNLAKVENSYPFHDSVRIVLGTILFDEKQYQVRASGKTCQEILTSILPNASGLKTPGVLQTAWDVTQFSGIINLYDDQTLYKLSRLYTLQASGVTNTSRKLAEFLLEGIINDPDQTKVALHTVYYLFRELAGQEQYIIKFYDITRNEIMELNNL